MAVVARTARLELCPRPECGARVQQVLVGCRHCSVCVVYVSVCVCSVQIQMCTSELCVCVYSVQIQMCVCE